MPLPGTRGGAERARFCSPSLLSYSGVLAQGQRHVNFPAGRSQLAAVGFVPHSVEESPTAVASQLHVHSITPGGHRRCTPELEGRLKMPILSLPFALSSHPPASQTAFRGNALPVSLPFALQLVCGRTPACYLLADISASAMGCMSPVGRDSALPVYVLTALEGTAVAESPWCLPQHLPGTVLGPELALATC